MTEKALDFEQSKASCIMHDAFKHTAGFLLSRKVGQGTMSVEKHLRAVSFKAYCQK